MHNVCMSAEEVVQPELRDKTRHLIPVKGKGDPYSDAIRARAQEVRKARKYRYVDDVQHAEDLLSKSLSDAANAAIAIVRGEARQYLINHKTGEVNEVPVDPATRLKAAEFIFKRIAGEPERQTTMELGEGAAGVFKVLVGAAAEEHWQNRQVIEIAPTSVVTLEGEVGSDDL